MRRKTRAGRSSHWQIVIGGKPSLNSEKLRKIINSARTISTENRSAIYISRQKRIKIYEYLLAKRFLRGGMSSQGGEALVFNTMVKPNGKPEETRKEGLSVEAKVMIWAHGKLSPNKKGWKKGGKEGKINTSKMGDRMGMALSRRERCVGDITRTRVKNRHR